MKSCAVIPAYNEATRIADVIKDVRAYVDVVVVVDDGSIDDTAHVATTAGAHVYRHMINRGQGAALRTGIEAALQLGAEVLVHIDADGQHDPGSIASLLAPIQHGEADIVFGSRFLGMKPEGMPLLRRCVLYAARLFSTFALGISRHFTDPQSGLRAMSAVAARSIRFTQDRKAHCSEILHMVSRSDLRVMEIPTRVTYTADTLEKGNKTSDALQIAWHLFIGGFRK
jgi:glycosyltransferase involved in cell wall biosynthesis